MKTEQYRSGFTRWVGLSFIEVMWGLSFLGTLFLFSIYALGQLRLQLQGPGFQEFSSSFYLIENAVYSVVVVAGALIVIAAIALSRRRVSLKNDRQLQGDEHSSGLSNLSEDDQSGELSNLREKERWFYSLFDASPSCIFMKDADLRYTFANKRWLDLKDITLESVIGKNDLEVFGETDVVRKKVDEEKSILDGGLAVKKEQQMTVSGQNLTFLSDMVPLKDNNGEPFAIGGWCMDITYFKQTYEELEKARQQADSLNKAKSSFLATMSHEIRTPMNGVIGSLDLLRVSKLDTSQKQLVDTVNESAFSLLTIINDILDFSKIESGKLEFDRVSVNLEQLLASVAGTLIPQAQQKEVELFIYTDTSVPDVYADLVRLRQIVSNLCSNAIKFTGGKEDGKGRVTVRCTVSSTDDSDNATINLSVEDNGIGISEEAQSQLFQPFIQAEESTTRRFGGSGLGLSITSRLIEMMEGEIGVRSTLGEGAVFTASIPFSVVPDSEDEPSHVDLSDKPVLFIKGEPYVNELFINHIKNEGMPCYEVSRLKEEWSNVSIDHSGHLVIVIVDCWENDLGVPALKRELEEQFSYIDKLSFLILSQGYLMQPQLQTENTTKLDYNGLGRKAFLNTIDLLVNKSSNSKVNTTIDGEDVGDKNGKLSTELNADKLLLLAEDNEVNQKVLKHQLSVLGYPVEIANDGQEALSLWIENKEKYQIILTDCHMPNLDGYGLARAVREEEQGGQRIPIIAITADALQGADEQCRLAGMDDYLTKPLLISDLSDKLEKWLAIIEGANEATKSEQSKDSVDEGEQQEEPGESINPETLIGFLGTSTYSTLREFYLQYLRSSEQIVEDISGLSKKGGKESGEGIVKLAHQLKSSSYAVGAKGLGDTCLALEKVAGQEGDGEQGLDCKVLVSKLMSQYAGVQLWIEENYSNDDQTVTSE